MTRVVAAVGIALLAAACQPLSATPPFHFVETPDALARGRVAAAGAVGAGNFEDIGGGVGAAGRVRYGLGEGHEARAEAVVIQRINDDDPTPQRPWLGPSTAFLYKGSWKLALTHWFAVSLGAGGSHSETGNALGGDAAAMAGTRSAWFGGKLRPYVGLRGTFAVPVGRDRDERGGPTQGAVLALGGGWDLSSTTQLGLELGLMHEWNRGYFATAKESDREVMSQDKGGGYLALGVTYFFGGRVRAPEPK